MATLTLYTGVELTAVEGCYVSARRIITQVYDKLVPQFEEEGLQATDDDDDSSDDDDDSDHDDSDEDDDEGADDDDDDDSDEGDDEEALLSFRPPTAIPEPSSEDQPVADPSRFFF